MADEGYAMPCHPTAFAAPDWGGLVRCPLCKRAYTVNSAAQKQARGKVVPTDLPFQQVRDTVPIEDKPQQEKNMTVTETSTEATEPDAIATAPEAGEDAAATKARASKGALEAQVREITDLYASGALTEHPTDRPLTPHNIAIYIAKRNSLEKAPSAGAVTANLDRWEKVGFAVLSHEKPKSFVGYTVEATTVGLSELKARHRVGLSDAKKAAKAAAAPAVAEAHPITADDAI